MLNHTYTSVKNANLVDCGKKQHIPSQPSPLLRDNYLGEYRTELDKKKVLANLGIATDLSLEWEYIKGDIGRSKALMDELDSRTKYISKIDGFYKTVVEGILYLETIVGGEQEGEEEQNNKLAALEQTSKEIKESLVNLKTYIENAVSVDIETLLKNLNTVTEKVNNITNLIQVSTKANNALTLIPEDSENLQEGETPGLYVPDLSETVSTATLNIEKLQEDVQDILDTYVTKEELGGEDFDFVNESDFTSFKSQTNFQFSNIQQDLAKTVKTGEDGHVNTLFVNTIGKNNDDRNIKLTDSFEMESGIPLDIRFVVETLDDLLALPVNVCYSGMGVIVNSLSALYILRKPLEGITLNQEYVGNVYNWKCPEDLVIEVVTQELYDAKEAEGSINPNMFYYIHEEVVEEPQRKDFTSDEEYTEALNKWLRVLLQKYMSAVWGLEIESLVANKASNISVSNLGLEIQKLESRINDIQGGSSEVNLKEVSDLVNLNKVEIDNLIKEEGVIATIQDNVLKLNTTLTNDYVTKEEISVENPELNYIFVKLSVFDDYIEQHESNVSKEVSTESVVTLSITLGENDLTTSDGTLLLGEEKLAFKDEIPNIVLMDNKTFSDKDPSELDENSYYYIFDEDSYVLDSDFTNYKENQTRTLNNLTEGFNANKRNIGTLSNLLTDNKSTLVESINELFNKINALTEELNNLKQQLPSSELPN